MIDTVFYSVNEEGEPYDRHDSLTPALTMLREFPNDTVVIVTVGSPTDEKYRAALSDQSLTVSEAGDGPDQEARRLTPLDIDALLANPHNATLPTTQADADAWADALIAALQDDLTGPRWIAAGEILGRLTAAGFLSDHIFDICQKQWAKIRPTGAMPPASLISNFGPALLERNVLGSE